MNGTVKFFHNMKGFGFIAGEDGKEYFVHSSGLKEGVSLNENDSVVFDVEQGDRGPKAVNVGKGTGSSSEEAPAEEAEDSSEEAPAEESEDSSEESDETKED